MKAMRKNNVIYQFAKAANKIKNITDDEIKEHIKMLYLLAGYNHTIYITEKEADDILKNYKKYLWNYSYYLIEYAFKLYNRGEINYKFDVLKDRYSFDIIIGVFNVFKKYYNILDSKTEKSPIEKYMIWKNLILQKYQSLLNSEEVEFNEYDYDLLEKYYPGFNYTNEEKNKIMNEIEDINIRITGNQLTNDTLVKESKSYLSKEFMIGLKLDGKELNLPKNI